jgi:hypothetical protein
LFKTKEAEEFSYLCTIGRTFSAGSHTLSILGLKFEVDSNIGEKDGICLGTI